MITTYPITLTRKSTPEERQQALQQIYAQVLERQPYASERHHLAKAEKDFLGGKLGVRHFLQELGNSEVYLNSFYFHGSNLKFIEWCFKHFLGRAPIDCSEIGIYTDLLLKHGTRAVISEMLGSDEYRKAFGCFTVPHARIQKFYPSTQNFLDSTQLNQDHADRRGRSVPRIYSQQLGLVCENGICSHPEVDGAYRTSDRGLLAKEIEELLRML